jgi:hypothetical protein
MSSSISALINRPGELPTSNSNDPVNGLNGYTLGKVLAFAGNIRSAGRVSKEWRDQSSNGHTQILNGYYENPLLRSVVMMDPHEGLSDQKIVKRAICRLHKHLLNLDPMIAKLLSDQTYPIDAASLEKLIADACLIKLFDRLLDKIPREDRPVLEGRFEDKVILISFWMNNPANEAILAKVMDLDLSHASLIIVPPVIGRLVHLQDLNLSFNHIIELPIEISNLTMLKCLNLISN